MVQPTNLQSFFVHLKDDVNNQRVICRLTKKVADVMTALQPRKIHMLSTVPLPGLEKYFNGHLMLQMSWTEALHESCLYSQTHNLAGTKCV